MSLQDLVQKDSIRCPDYKAEKGSKRCQTFGSDRSCSMDSHPVCEEWLRVNPDILPANEDAATFIANHPDYVKDVVDGRHFRLGWRARILQLSRPGSPVTPAAPPQPEPARARQSPPEPLPASLAPPAPAGERSPLWPTEADVVAFGSLGLELRIGSPTLSEDLWLVPAYTGKDRLEMTAHDAIAVCRIVTAFPGSKVADVIRQTQTQAKEATQC